MKRMDFCPLLDAAAMAQRCFRAGVELVYSRSQA
ncbi:UNVERIFIED_ORG: hypothetical protein J2W85_005838 [Ensifer adhaerens]|nr:hypothetical protein [Ensifer adhaerens]